LKVKRIAGAVAGFGLVALIFYFTAHETYPPRRDEPAGESFHPSKKSPSSLPFIALSLDEALVRARAERKLVFVDLSADWCHWCTKMDEDVFPDERVKTALTEFIAIKVDTDKRGGRSVASRYRVNGLPAYLLLDGDGQVVGRFDGYLPVDAFLLKLRRASGSRS
jgi:thiol:disulfide interchange protein